MIEFSKNKWIYSTIGLLAVLAVGFSFPQASADVTNNLMHMVMHIFDNTEEIKADVEDIKEKTDNLPNDPASESDITGRDYPISVSGVVSSSEGQVVLLQHKTNAYGEKVSGYFTFFPHSDINGDNMLDGNDCTATMSIRFEASDDAGSDQVFGATSPQYVSFSGTHDDIYDRVNMEFEDVGPTDSCAYTVLLILEDGPV